MFPYLLVSWQIFSSLFLSFLPASLSLSLSPLLARPGDPEGLCRFKLNLSFLCCHIKLKPIPKCLKAQTASRLPAGHHPSALTERRTGRRGERGDGGGCLTHNEATGFVSSSEDLVKLELCRAAFHTKGEGRRSRTAERDNQLYCIHIYYTPALLHPPTHGTHKPTLKTDHHGEKTHFLLSSNSDFLELKLFHVSVMHNMDERKSWTFSLTDVGNHGIDVQSHVTNSRSFHLFDAVQE